MNCVELFCDDKEGCVVEMKHRSIVVPKDADAERLLDYAEAVPNQLIELPLSVSDTDLLWRENIFDIINEAGDSNIDDYEDDEVIGEDNILQVIRALKLQRTP